MKSDYSSLLLLVEKYLDTDSASAAHVLESIDEEEAANILKRVPVKSAVAAARHLHDIHMTPILLKLPPSLATTILNEIDAQQAAAIFLRVPKGDLQSLSETLTEKRRKQIQEILTYPEDSAGRIMSTNFLAFHGDLKVKDAIQKIRQQAQKGHAASYAYVVDDENKLVGVLNMYSMLLAVGDASLASIMRTDVFTVNSFMDRESVANEISARHFFAVPVVDVDRRLLGIIKAEQMIDDVQEEASEDIQKMFGAGGDEKSFSPIGFSLKKRLPWLYVNLATAFLAGAVVALFEDIIHRITVLAIYLPIMAGQGGNAGAQSLAVVMRGLVLREISSHKAVPLILKETRIGIISGLAIGTVTGWISWFWHSNGYLGIVVGLGMLANMIVAGFAGAAIPLTMKRLGLDPAQCSNIILTTITDVLGIFIFLGFAIILQSHLI